MADAILSGCRYSQYRVFQYRGWRTDPPLETPHPPCLNKISPISDPNFFYFWYCFLQKFLHIVYIVLLLQLSNSCKLQLSVYNLIYFGIIISIAYVPMSYHLRIMKCVSHIFVLLVKNIPFVSPNETVLDGFYRLKSFTKVI